MTGHLVSRLLSLLYQFIHHWSNMVSGFPADSALFLLLHLQNYEMHCMVGICVCCGRTVPRGWIAATRPHGFSRCLSTMMHQPDWQLDTPVLIVRSSS